MSDTQTKPWSDNPNAQKISYVAYSVEKADFAGILIAAILHGAFVVLFFRCMTALLDPSNLKRWGIKWGLVCYTVVMFSCATVATGTAQNLASVSFIDNHGSPGVEGVSSPALWTIYSKPASIVPNFVSLLNYWLADGFLLHRCYVIYGRNLWIVAFPCLMYFASAGVHRWDQIDIRISHLSITVSLNLFLTLAIVIRLVLYGKNVRAATGSRAGISGFYKTVATIFIESSALYAVTSLLLIGLCASGSSATSILVPIHAETQVIAPLLIIQRVANRCALTSNTIVTGNIGSLHASSSEESTGGSCVFPDAYPTCSDDHHRRGTSDLGIAVETRVNPQDSRVYES